MQVDEKKALAARMQVLQDRLAYMRETALEGVKHGF